MDYAIRNVRDTDLESVLALNQSEVPHVGSVDLEGMRWFATNADYFRVAVSDATIGAYLVGFRPGGEYGSLNYRWFCDRYTDFGYIDRIAVAAAARRRGLASRLYDDFVAFLPPGVPRLACEVNLKPPNPTSLAFHRGLGFRQVGTRQWEGGDKEVAMLLKPLC